MCGECSVGPGGGDSMAADSCVLNGPKRSDEGSADVDQMRGRGDDKLNACWTGAVIFVCTKI